MPKSEKIDWGEVIAERENRLESAIMAILPALDTLARKQIVSLVIRVSQGEFWTAASQAVGIVWAQFRVNLSRSVAFRELWHAAEDAGEEWRKADLEAATWDRARNGWLEPVLHQGKIVAHVRKFTDRLAEVHLRASNPAKFAVTGAGDGGTAQVQVVIWGRGSDAPSGDSSPTRNQDAPPKVIDVAPQ